MGTMSSYSCQNKIQGSNLLQGSLQEGGVLLHCSLSLRGYSFADEGYAILVIVIIVVAGTGIPSIAQQQVSGVLN